MSSTPRYGTTARGRLSKAPHLITYLATSFNRMNWLRSPRKRWQPSSPGADVSDVTKLPDGRPPAANPDQRKFR